MLSDTCLLTTDSLSIGYRENNFMKILQQDQSLKLHEGDMVCLIGPNGCGKSTLIRTLSGIQPALSGIISIMGRDSSGLSFSDISRLISTVLTDRTAVDQITVEEIVALGRYNFTNWLGILSGRDQAIVDDSIIKVGLEALKTHTYATLSDGEKQRSFIAKALAADTPILLLDEPTAHLDLPNRVEILSLLRNLTRTSGHAVLVSTHDLDLALQLADEIWLMLPDRTMLCGTPEEIKQGRHLDQVFGNDSVYFNEETGSFTLKTDKRKSVNLIGNGTLAEAARMAFHRLGFDIQINAEPIATIHVDQKDFTIEYDDVRHENLQLAEICRILRKLSSEISYDL